MKKHIIFLLLAVMAGVSMQAKDTWMLQGVEYQVDTLFHNQIGPGTMQTSLWFHTDVYRLRVFYCTIDLTNPYVSLSGVCATDKLAGNERIAAMAQRKSQPGKRYYAGINGDFFVTSGYSVRNVSRVGTPVGSTVVEGQIFRARNNATLYKNFIVDTEGQVYVDPFFFGGTVKAPDGTTATLGGINTYANEKAASNQNKITIYNDLYYGSTDETDTVNSVEVEARLAEGFKFETAKPFKMVVTGDPSTKGDMTIPTGGYVIHAHGKARPVLNNLQIGDTIEVSPSWTFGDKSVEPYEVISGNPKILADGVTLDSEGDRGDASAQHPRTAIGFSDGGKKVYFLVVDGRSPLSNGVRTKVLADIMRYAGATDGMNLDGGGSSTLYTSALGIRNRPSDGSERADGNGFFAISSAPDDDVIADIRFQDFDLKAPKYGMYTPRFYGYNQYGMLIDSDVKGVTLSCPESLGHIMNDTTFYGDGEGTAMLTAHYGNISVDKKMTIIGSVDAISITNDSVINDTYRDYPVDVESLVGEATMPINPMALAWTSTDDNVVQINPETGVLRGLQNGRAEVIGTIDQLADTMLVIVEKPTARVMPVDPNPDMSTWKITQTGGKDGVATTKGNGFEYTYTGASGRAPKIMLSKAFRLWSLPDTVRLRVNPGEAPLKNIIFGMRANGSNMSYQTVTPEEITPDKELVIDLPTDSWIDAEDLGNFPLSISSIQVNMNASEVGKEYKMHFLGFETVYAAVPKEDPNPLRGDVDGNGTVNVSDVTELVNMILGITAKNAAVADVDGNGVVNVSDVTELVNIILGVS